MIHFDIVDPAKGRAELILDPTLLPEHFGLYFLGRLCHLVGRHPYRGQQIERTDQRHSHRRRSPRRGTCRCLRINSHLKSHILRHLHIFDGRLQQRKVVPLAIAQFDRKTLAEILGVDDDAVLDLVTAKDLELGFGIGVDAYIEDRAVFGEPSIGPTHVVADANRNDAVDNA